MSKDFGQFLERELNAPQKVVLDPYLHTNSVIEKQISSEVFNHASIAAIASIATGIILMPLNTVSIALQLSVARHKHSFMDEHAHAKMSKQLAVKRTELTLSEKRRLELQIRSGGDHRPFTAPVYSSLTEAIRGLMGQGFLGFYKGFIPRTLINSANSFLGWWTISNIYKEKKLATEGRQVGVSTGMSLWIMCLMDMILNPVYTIEARLVTQNRLSYFKTFKNMKKVTKNHERISWGTGALATGTINRLFLEIIMNMEPSNIPKLTALFTLNRLLIYPILVAHRRIICQADKAGMLPIRYDGLSHAMKLILQQEGLRGLYKGFGLHCIYLYTMAFISQSLVFFDSPFQNAI